MIDINIIKANGKYYSVKCKLIFNETEKKVVTAKVIALDLIEPNGATSFKKLKTMFSSSNPNEVLSKLKYPYIYEAITKKLIQKFKMDVLNI